MAGLNTSIRKNIDGLESALLFFRACEATVDTAREHLWVVHLDVANRVQKLSHYLGDVSSAFVPIKRIVLDAIHNNSSGILLAHNHPSGDPRPSQGDCRVTRKLAMVAEVLDCRVFDHLILAGLRYSSFRAMGLL